MRAFALSMLLLAITASASDQEETLLPSDPIRSHGFGGPVVNFGPVNASPESWWEAAEPG